MDTKEIGGLDMPKVQKPKVESLKNSQNEIKGERWKDITGFEGYYQISDHGRLKSFKAIKDGYILSQTNKKGGYFSVILEIKGQIVRHTRIHILVAEAFLPNLNNFKMINHKDSNKQNNHYSNLEWCSAKHNCNHAIRANPNMLSGMIKYNTIDRPRPVVQITMKGRILNRFINCVEAGRKTGICSRNIHHVASKTEYKPGKTRKQAGGFLWEYDD